MSSRARGLVLLDRDGVINRDSDQYIRSVAEWQPLPGSLSAIADLTRAGFALAVITNQSGIGRGYFTEQVLADIHATMTAKIAEAGGLIRGIYYCPHRPDEECDCRKPKPKLLVQAMQELGFGPGETWYVGDKWSDVEAARSAGVRPILVGPRASTSVPVTQCADLAAAAALLMTQPGSPT